jgi:N4-gp56 family major capsid protein
MAVIQRASLPEEFYDITSAKLLKQPEPQYLHAMLAKMAIVADLQVSALGMPGRGPSGQGAEYTQAGDDRYNFSDPIMSEAIMAIVGLGTAPGHTIRMNRPKFTDTTYTQASREVATASTISTVPVDVSSEQVAVTVKRFAGPYDQTNARVAPYAIDEFDSKMSIHKLASIVGTHMKRDFDKWLDAVLVALFDIVASGNTLYPTGMTADNDSTQANSFPMDFDLLSRAEQKLDELNIPVFGNGRRIAIVTPRQAQQLKNDSQFARYVMFHKDVNPIFTSYIGSVGNLDILKSNTLTTSSNSSSVSINYAQVFGPGKVGLGVGEMPRVLASSDDNYGLQSKNIWEFEAGFVNLDSRFGLSLHTD